MTTDKTPATLATAKPGGCVKLGDSLTRFRCAGYDPTDGSGPIMVADPEGPWVLAADILSISRNGNAAREEAETSSSKDDWFGDVLGSIGTVIPLEAALSAQPSPGGQGDALLESLVARWRNHAEEIGVSDNLLCQKIANCTMRHAAELQATLAARQPVGEPVGEVYQGSSRLPQARLTKPLPVGALLYAAPPAHAVDLPYPLDADPAGIRARVADVITGTLMVGAQGHTPPPAGHWAEPFWQAARADAVAQAVDLGQFQDVLLAANSRLQSVIDDDKTKWSERHKASKEQAALYPLLALIESKAVGK